MVVERGDHVRLPPAVDEAVELLVKQIRSEPLVQSSLVAISTAKLLRYVVSAVAPRGQDTCAAAVQAVGRRLNHASPLVLVVENTVRRVLKIVREEFELATAEYSNGDGTSQQNSSAAKSISRAARDGITSSIEEYVDEVESASDNIVEQAVGHIHANEVVLAYGGSVTVELFLLEAAKKRKFEVIVAEHAPHCAGHALARKLATTGGLSVTLVPDSAVFAVMSRVHKVILGAHAVMANGALMASCGAHMTAAAAKIHAKPVVVCAGLYKLTPVFPHDRDSLNEMLSPASVVSYDELAGTRNIHVVNPAFDHVPPELVTLFITNNGGYIPAFVYRLLREYYDSVDTQL